MSDRGRGLIRGGAPLRSPLTKGTKGEGTAEPATAPFPSIALALGSISVTVNNGPSGLPAPRQPARPPARTRPRPERQQEVRSRVRPLDPFKVILHNDDQNTMEHVVESLVECVSGLNVPRATEIMLEAHNTGRAVVVICPLELAELYRDRLKSRGLTVSIERDQ